MKNLPQYLRYDWPVHFILLFTNWLPDNVVFMKLRGKLLRLFLGACGENLEVGRNVTLQSPANIYFGDNVYLAYGCCFLAGTDIHVGNEVLFGPYCVIVSANHTRKGRSYYYGTPDARPIYINSGCWLAAHVIVTPGTKIGEGTCLAAGAVARGEISSNVMLGGVPARVIKKLGEDNQ